jgi:hypothetical protein
MDGGNNWLLVSGDLPNRWVTSVLASADDSQTAYVTFSGYRYNSDMSHVYKTTDGGTSWIDISGNLPEIPVNEILTLPGKADYFVATDIGVYHSIDGGASWELFGANFPNVIVSDLRYHEATQTLLAGTFGRGMLSIDVSPVVTSNQSIYAQDKTAFTAFPNPTTGNLTFDYFLPEEDRYRGMLTDASGHRVRPLFSDQVLSSGHHQLTIAVHDLPEGIYFAHLKSQKGTIKTIKVIKR